ncbi:AT-rich interactive domain-containing protein 5B isoform X1 [Stegostoma tigrinum]|uniref:AT-rich interactive domain-containing protein 5B isoform X1 n=3 Tax=Stegostoma tigrinum TaxID=3053191 RepID=UPI00202B15B5|nr:AT-rich interactive domain-containing protein 5B isoform X1 [Stegostoma tigrinum]
MEPDSVKWVGSPCGLHGAYIFYKAFKFRLEGRPRILSLGDFFFVRCKPGAPICIAELQLLWEERNNKQLLSSSKLYFLPEDTPKGRSIGHGEDEVVAVSEKVVVKLDDLMKWACSDFGTWTRGLGAVSLKPSTRKELGVNGQKEALNQYRHCTLNSGLNFKDVLKEKADLDADDADDSGDADDTKIIVLSYPQYCRYRTMLKRIQNRSSSWLVNEFVMALGGIAILNGSTRILYCRDTFDHPTLIENESICDEFAPNLKGRPRKKKHPSQKRDTQAVNGQRDSNEDSDGKASAKAKCEPKATMVKPKNNSSNCKNLSADEKSKAAADEECRAEEQTFLVTLYKYMKERNTPIERIPYLGFKQINLWTMFQAAQNLGGYEAITARRQWKQIYDELGGNPGSTSAATCTRRHYERLILPYERYIKGEEDKPLPPVKPRKQESSPPESESKVRAAAAKRKTEPNRKVKRDRDVVQKVKECSEAIAATEGSREMDKWRADVALSRDGVVTQTETGEKEQDRCDISEGSVGKGTQAKDKVSKTNNEQSNGKEAELLSLHQGLTAHSTDIMVQSQAECRATSASCLDHESPQQPVDRLANDLQEKVAGTVAVTEKEAEKGYLSDQGSNAVSPGAANSSVHSDHSPKDEVENWPGGLRPESGQRLPQGQVGKGNPNLSPGPLKEKEELLVTTKTEACPSYLPLVYSRGHPGIMSPLAKKKFLSQVSGSLPNNYPIGAPPPLLSSKKCGEDGEEMVTAESNFLQGSTPEQLAISRPSVIQHAHSFQRRNIDERGEALKHDGLNKLSDSEAANLSKHHLNCSESFKGRASYPFTSDPVENENKGSEKKGCQPSQVSSFLADFYSSPHLHNLYRHTEHHLINEHTSKYLSTIIKDKSSSLMQSKNQDAVYLRHLSTLHRSEKKCAVKHPTEEQPTDLSLPKLKKTLSKSSSNSAVHLPTPLDIKSTTASTQSAHTDCNPKACRVPPMPVPTTTKSGEAALPPSTKLEEGVRPAISSKGGSQIIGSSKPVKRNREGTDNGSNQTPEKKLRAVSPMPLAKELALKEKSADLEGESSKNQSSGIILEGHKFPLPTPIFPGVYPGAFVSQVQDMCDGLGSAFPVDYAHPLQYLKNQAVLSPLMQPLAIHSFMIPAMQRQILASTGASPQLYRHLSAAAAPVAASYGDLLHHSLYPLASLNPQVAYSTSPISSLHPSTKL